MTKNQIYKNWERNAQIQRERFKNFTPDPNHKIKLIKNKKKIKIFWNNQLIAESMVI